jgi:hypothetical protein
MSHDWKKQLRQWWRTQRVLSIAKMAMRDYADTTAIIDPYWDRSGSWLNAATSDDCSYGGVLQWFDSLPGEGKEQFLRRAQCCADQWNLFFRARDNGNGLSE